MTIQEALREGTTLLSSSTIKTAKVESPNLDAALLLAELLHVNRAQLFVMANESFSQKHYRCFQKLLKRRLEGECIAYILGRKEFRGLDFFVSPGVLVPRPDTETLVETALENLKKKKEEGKTLKVLDLCTGSGAVAIALKNEMPELKLWASDISSDALTVARKNSVRHQVEIHFIISDLFNAIKYRYDLIISNPPYVASDEIQTLTPEVQREGRLALDGGKDGLDIIRRIIEEVGNHLIPGGTLLMEADPRQMEDIIGKMESHGFNECRLFKDLSGQHRVISGSIH